MKWAKDFLESKFYLFVLGIMLIKILLMGLFSSDYQEELFIPFISDFIQNGGNPYQRFYEQQTINAFPYPPGMLFFECIGGVVSLFLGKIFFKLPGFLTDLLGLMVLIRFFPEKRRYLAVFYYASPVILYAVYMHGQLDLIPMVMLIIALYFLIAKENDGKRYAGGIIFTALALLCKLHIIAVLPMVFFYLWNHDGLAKATGYLVTVILAVVAGICPFWSEGFRQMVLFNREQQVLTQVSLAFDTVRLYVPVAAVLFVYLLAFKASAMNKELFLNLCGIVFSVFLAFCPPMPGWYVWVVPFFALFFASTNEEKYKNMAVYGILNGCYLIYFLFFHDRGMVDLYFLGRDCSFLKIRNEMFANGMFTILCGLLVYLLVCMYQLGIASNNLYRRKNIPFTIGIAGDSGAGKSTMIDLVEKGLGASNLLYIEGDGDHRWERGNRYWDDYTALNPKANYLYRQARDLKELREGSAVRRVDYDHGTGRFTAPKRMRSRKYVLLCGLHAMYLPQTRKRLDLKIYMDADETLRRYWKIQRDVAHRGHSKEAVLASIEERMPDARKYIYPQKEYADIIVRYYDPALVDCLEEGHEVKLRVRLQLSSAVDIEPLVDRLQERGAQATYEYSEDLRMQTVDLAMEDMEHTPFPVGEIAKAVIPQIEEITREDLDDAVNAKDGILILFLLLLISYKMRGTE